MDLLHPTDQSLMNVTDDNGDTEFSIIFVLQGLIIFIFALLIMVTNIVNLIVIPRLPDINEASKVFYNCLSFADLILGIVLLPALPSAIVGDWPFGDFVCKVCGFGVTTVAGLSSSSLLLLNLDRFFSIASPLRYVAIMDKRKALIISLSACLFEVAFLTIVVFVNPLGADIISYTPLGACIMSFSEPRFVAYSFTIFAIFIWSFLPILAIMYARIICISKRHVRRIQVQELTNHTNRVTKLNDTGYEHGGNRPPSDKKPVRTTASHRAIRMTLLVTGTYVMAWMPFTISQIMIAMGTDVSIVIRALVCWPLLLNPLCNVIIYSVTKRSYRILTRNLMKGCLRCSLSDLRNANSHEILV